MTGWIVAAVLMAALAAVYMNRPTKRFGLTEAKAALRYVRGDQGGPQVAQAVMAVVVGVLNYRNTVAEDVKTETARITEETTKRDSEIADNEKTIEELRAEIERLRSSNTSADAQAAQLRELADIFSG